VHLGFNVNYLLDVCNTVPTGAIDLIIAENDASLLMEPAQKEQQKCSSLFVIMPVLL
jgi:DNA polymerase III sliding clamp (beta) subunit (PCNA family)